MEFLREQADRPFGDIEGVSGRALQPFSRAGWDAADNLLTRAQRALDAGDRDRAVAYVDRAVALPFDEHEMAAPAALVGSTMLFALVSDQLEDSATDDSRWLDAALDLLSTTQSSARFDLRDVLEDISQDYDLERREHRRIRAATASIPPQAELRDLVGLPAEDLSGRILAILELCAAYEVAVGSPTP